MCLFHELILYYSLLFLNFQHAAYQAVTNNTAIATSPTNACKYYYIFSRLLRAIFLVNNCCGSYSDTHIYIYRKQKWLKCLSDDRIRTELHSRATQRITGVERNVLSNSHHLIKYALFCIWPPFICVTSGSKGQLHKWPTQFFFRFIIKFHVCVRCPHTKLNGEKKCNNSTNRINGPSNNVRVCVCGVSAKYFGCGWVNDDE